MKLEKINNDKIKCIIGLDELANRHIEVEKLKYGSSETKALFKDIMDKAYKELDFDIKGMPLMIEAIPLSNGEIMLIVSKVKDNENSDDSNENINLENHTFEKASQKDSKNIPLNQAELSNGILTIILNNFKELSLISTVLDSSFIEKDSLFFDEQNSKYYLYLHIKDDANLNLNILQKQLSEFTSYPIRTYNHNYLKEKFTLIEGENAIYKLKNL